MLAVFAAILLGISMPFLLFAQYFEPLIGPWPFFISILTLPTVCGYYIKSFKLGAMLYAIASILAFSISLVYMTTLFSTPDWIKYEWLKRIWITYNRDIERATIAIPFVIAIHTLAGASVMVVAKFVALWRSEQHFDNDARESPS